MGTLYAHFLKVLETPEPLALATLLRTDGSTPQEAGASALFSPEGLVAGTLGGGILEHESGLRAASAIAEKKSLVFEYDLNAGIEDSQGAACGGKTMVLIDADPRRSMETFRELSSAYKMHKPGALITYGTVGRMSFNLISRKWISPELPEDEYPEDIPVTRSSVQRAIHNRYPLLIEIEPADDFPRKGKEAGFVFIEPVLPPEKLILAGGGHVGRALIGLAGRLGFDITVIDNRAGIIPENERTGNVEVRTVDIAAGIADQKIDHQTYIVIATHGHQYDADALKACIRSEAAYIGMMGSRRKLSLMREKFIREGWATAQEFDRIHAPIGINIRSETVDEIAISIAAELVKIRGMIRDHRKVPRICAMILAAGESKRMKQQKLLLDFNGESFIKTIVRKCTETKADETLVILGSHSTEVSEEIRGSGAGIVYNPLFRQGMLSSVQCGFNTISRKINAVVLLLGDQPMFDAWVVDRLIDTYRETRAGIILPVYRGNRGHPVLIASRFREQISTLDPAGGLRMLMRANPEEIQEIEVDSPSILKDIDHVEDYKIAIN